jgi:transketolase N-terminal domain/subunit
MTDHELQLKAVQLRQQLLGAICGAGAGHTGGGLSCLDILNVLYLAIRAEAFGSYLGWEVYLHQE